MASVVDLGQADRMAARTDWRVVRVGSERAEKYLATELAFEDFAVRFDEAGRRGDFFI